MRSRVAAARESPLFDVESLTRDLEGVYLGLLAATEMSFARAMQPKKRAPKRPFTESTTPVRSKEIVLRSESYQLCCP